MHEVSKNNPSTLSDFVIRDSNGSPLLAGSRNLGYNNILLAEPLALHEGFQKVLKSGFKKVQVEGHSQVLINCVWGTYDIPW
ncbi:hypothetical protein M0R45_018554 [Rubus argutus]|uniref:RNase H type-1 domain-containing protein n=1 Tax=Rubus argutus TaxID=59490 RepID=A0AAW1X4H1_RUBAR